MIFVIGVAHNTALGVDEPRIGGIPQSSLPAVLGQPSRRRNSALTLMAGTAPGHRAQHHHANRCAVGDDHVVGRCEDARARRNRALDVSRLHDLQERRHRAVVGAERRPGQHRHMSGWGDLVQPPVALRQDRAVLGPPQRDRLRRRALDLDDALALDERFETLGRQISRRVVRGQLFDQNVLIVQIGGGQTPADLCRCVPSTPRAFREWCRR